MGYTHYFKQGETMAILKKFREFAYKFTFERKKYLVNENTFDALIKIGDSKSDYSIIDTYGGMVSASRELYDSRKPPKFSDDTKIKIFKKAALKKYPAYVKKQKAADKKEDESFKKSEIKRYKDALKTATAAIKILGEALPCGLTPADLLNNPEIKGMKYGCAEIEKLQKLGFYSEIKLWYVEGFGWCLPTLLIKNASRGSTTSNRYYAIRLKDNGLVRIGHGPHVTGTFKIQLNSKNYKKLLKVLMPLLEKGAVEANQRRDDLSTRRLNSNRYRW